MKENKLNFQARSKRTTVSLFAAGLLGLASPLLNACTHAPESLPQPTQTESAAQHRVPAASPINIAGLWQSAAPEASGPGLYGFRKYRISSNAWSLTWTFYGDQKLTVPLFEVNVLGTYGLGGASASVAGAYDGVFKVRQKTLTALTDNAAVLQALGFATCNLVKGQPKSLYASGCGTLSSVLDCPQEYDVVKLSANGATLAAGRRPADGSGLCTPSKRPTALGYPLVRGN